MSDQYEAVKALLLSVYDEGLAWYRNAKSSDLTLFDRRTSGSYSIFEGREIHNVGSKPASSFPSKKILIMHPSGKEEESVLGLWLRWNFDANPFEFRIFLGQWSQIDGKRTFVAFRFEAPEQGQEHDYWHCQPCRNFGDKENVPDAALISHRFPTIPVNASNIVELTICALMASMGRKKAKTFVKKLLQDPAATSGGHLKSAYLRCCT